MKIKNYIKSAVLLLMAVTFGSCEKFLDVQPKTSVRENDLFVNEQGFQDALTGVYLNLGNASLYGRELSYGYVDALAGMYIETGLSSQYLPVLKNQYTDATAQAFATAIWLAAYNNIANLNNLITKIQSADKTMFTDDNYNLIRGEALGLRAMLHFDLFRLFGTSIANGGDVLSAIPYRTVYDAKIVGKSTGKEVMDKVLLDLTAAAIALNDDPLKGAATTTILTNRKVRMNYYAVKGLLARYYLWNNEIDKAKNAALEVINSEKFDFVDINSVTTADPAKNRVFTSEHLFGIYSSQIEVNYAGLLVPTSANSTGLLVDDARLTTQFESAYMNQDIRYTNLIMRYNTTQNTQIYFGKLYQPEDASTTLARRIPAMKIPEMYYIAAEALKETRPDSAVYYLNTVRTARSVTAQLSASLSATEIQDEIRKEYWKEMPLEGQMFYYYKRTNSRSIPGNTDAFDVSLYTVPLPPTETEYGF